MKSRIVHLPQAIRAMFRSGQFHDAIKCILSSQDKYFQESILNLFTANSFRRGFNFSDVQCLCRQVIKLEPFNHNIWIILIDSHLSKGDLDGAIEIVELAIKNNNTSYFMYNEAGILYVNARTYNQAEIAFNKSLALNPTFLPPLQGLGDLLIKNGRWQEASHHLEASLRIYKEDYRLHLMFSQVCLKTQHYIKAERLLNFILSQDGNNFVSLSNYGLCLQKLNKPMDSLPILLKALSLNPSSDYVLCILGTVYKDLGEFDKSIKAFSNAINLNPINYKAYLSMGEVYRFQCSYAAAIHAYKKCLNLNVESPSAYLAIYQCYKFLSKPMKSKYYLDVAFERFPHSLEVAAFLASEQYASSDD